MNKRQRIVVLVGVAIVAGMMLFPPWQRQAGGQFSAFYKSRSPTYTAPAGYGFLFYQPPDAERVDISRLAVQCAVVAVLAFGACVALARKSE